MRIICVGGGPAGLYLALLLKLREPRHEITVFERNVSGAAGGWGLTFWDDLLKKLYSADPVSAHEIERASFCWDKRVIFDLGGAQYLGSASLGYGIRRQRLLNIMANRALDVGVRIEFGHEVTALSQLPDADLIVACDGMNSRIRHQTHGFETNLHVGSNKYLWLGTDKVFGSFIYSFVQTDSGWVWAYGYGVDAESSTFIVECSPGTWAGLGLGTMPLGDCLSVLEKLFKHDLDGHQLIGRGAQWRNFQSITNKSWHNGKTVLVGDAAHTTHFSIGSGTKLAIEDAITLVRNLQQHATLDQALEAYEKERQAAIFGARISARLSARWFENISRYIDLKPHQFVALLRRRRSLLLPYFPPPSLLLALPNVA